MHNIYGGRVPRRVGLVRSVGLSEYASRAAACDNSRRTWLGVGVGGGVGLGVGGRSRAKARGRVRARARDRDRVRVRVRQ